VPFDYLVPDARLLPDESIRFFFIDRSWTDRLVDGAIAVGKIGTREQAHHHAQHGPVRRTLDVTERNVRDLQRKRVAFLDAKAATASAQPASPPLAPAGVVTGFLLRSAAVVGWPDMDVRAFDTVLPEPADAAAASAHQLPTLRLERLSPAVLLALFEGVPRLVWCEEPHHGVQFGVEVAPGRLPIAAVLGGSPFAVPRRRPDGSRDTSPPPPELVTAPVRAANPRVLSIAGLRRELAKSRASHPEMVEQTGSAALAIQLLDVPWRQRFEGEGGADMGRTATVRAEIKVVARVAEAATQQALRELL
jgi:hypothetical protein